MKNILHTLILTGFLFSVGFSLRAQPDSCYQAVTLSLCTPVTVGNGSATASGDDAFALADICAASLDRTLWFSFTAASAGTYQVTVTPVACTGAGNFEVGVLTGSCGGPFVSLACQSGAPPAPVVFTATSTQQVYIVVDGDAADTCSFSIEVCGSCAASFTPSVVSGSWPLPVTFTNTSQGTLFYSWDFGFIGGTTTDSDPVIAFDEPGTYVVVLTATSADMTCTDTAQVTITVSGASSMLVPNVFSPNDDGVNDFWQPDAHGMNSITGWIYNRYGELVYYWEGTEGGWDGHTAPAGQAVPEGEYFYRIIAEGYDGQSFDEHGIVTILR